MHGGALRDVPDFLPPLLGHVPRTRDRSQLARERVDLPPEQETAREQHDHEAKERVEGGGRAFHEGHDPVLRAAKQPTE